MFITILLHFTWSSLRYLTFCWIHIVLLLVQFSGARYSSCFFVDVDCWAWDYELQTSWADCWCLRTLIKQLIMSQHRLRSIAQMSTFVTSQMMLEMTQPLYTNSQHTVLPAKHLYMTYLHGGGITRCNSLNSPCLPGMYCVFMLQVPLANGRSVQPATLFQNVEQDWIPKHLTAFCLFALTCDDCIKRLYE
jgi:hypothetical protein